MSEYVPELQPLIGTRFTLLDSIRDAAFLGQGSGEDYGLGVTDNPLFFFTTYYVPGEPTTPRSYPIKLFWIGSPSGDISYSDEAFNIYVADVVPDNFYPGAVPNTGGPSSSWLVNPRLVLSISQAKTDITTWFDANYPGGATNGVGNGNSGSNDTYGTLAGGSSAVGNVTGIGVPGLEGQFWPIYDLVDNSVILYFSVKTPNCNTLSIYAYKDYDSEFSSPLGSSQFLGGCYAPGWTNVNAAFTDDATLLSSHRFSIVSPDPLSVNPRVSGTQNAVFLYSYGVVNGTTSDHGRILNGSVVTDIHNYPLSPGIALTEVTSGSPIVSQLVGEHFYTPDKLGSIFAANAVDSATPGYMCVFNAPAQIDRRNGTNSTGSVVLSEMILRVAYYDPSSGLAFGNDALLVAQTPEVLGTCRPQVTDLPDGKTKILYANFSWDQYLNCDYAYIEPDALSPRNQSKIRVASTGGNTYANPVTVYTYGKKKMLVRFLQQTASNNLENNPSAIQIIGAAMSDTSNGFSFGYNPFVGSKFLHSEGLFSNAAGISNTRPLTEFTVEDLDAYIMIQALGASTAATPFFYADLID